MRETTTTLAELEVGDNIYRDSHIYMVTNKVIHDDDTTVTVKLGYARRVDPTYDPLTELTSHGARPIIKYV
jgi:hypothetical protein